MTRPVWIYGQHQTSQVQGCRDHSFVSSGEQHLRYFRSQARSRGKVPRADWENSDTLTEGWPQQRQGESHYHNPNSQPWLSCCHEPTSAWLLSLSPHWHPEAGAVTAPSHRGENWTQRSSYMPKIKEPVSGEDGIQKGLRNTSSESLKCKLRTQSNHHKSVTSSHN